VAPGALLNAIDGRDLIFTVVWAEVCFSCRQRETGK
jgi:hypothetical protein